MPISHVLLTLAVVVIWGVNFLFVKLGLEEISPMHLCALRFFLASIPAVFFIKPPQVSFKIIALYGLVMFALQFGLVFTAMHVGMTAGMASVIMQVQVFFSMFLAMFVMGERPNLSEIVGALVSFSGIAVVAMHFDNNVTFLGFVLVLAAATTWGFGNLITKKVKVTNLISLVVWGTLVAFVPTFLAAIFLEGPSSMMASYQHISWKGIIAVIYIVYASTWLGYGLWNWLLGHHPVSTVVPFTLLIPVVGLLSSVLVLGEPFQLWKLTAGLLVISGLCINLIGARLFVSKPQEAV